jgi:uncharacterized RDD family membrane protein YckC
MASNMGDDRFAPPQAHVADVALPSDGLVLASRGRRLAGAILDVVALLFLLWLVSVVTPWNPFDSSDEDLLTPDLAIALGEFLAFLLLNAYLLATRGQTIGKALLQMRIVRPDGAPVSLGRMLGLRYGVASAFNIIPGVGMAFTLIDSLLIFRSSKRCLHDDIADTVVIKL